MAASLKELFERVAALRVEQELREASSLGETEPLSAEARLKHAIEDAAASGELLYLGVRWTVFAVSLAGALTGFGSLMALTRGSGDTPVNVLWLIGLAVVFPAITALISAGGALLLLRSTADTRSTSLMMDLVRSLIARGVRVAAGALERSDPRHQKQVQAARGALVGNYTLIQPVVPWMLLRVSQYFALWLSIGFALALVLRLATIDLTFGWHTTMQGVSESMPQIVHALSAPFAWISHELQVPDALIRASQYSRYQRAFVDDAYAVAHNGAWWPFLCAGVVFWGVFPRILLLSFARFQERRAIQEVLRTTAPLHAIQQRIAQQRAAEGGLFESMEGEDGTDPMQELVRAAAHGRAAQPAAPLPTPTLDSPQRAAFLYWEQDVAPHERVLDAMRNLLGVKTIFEATWGNDADEDTAHLNNIASLAPAVVCIFVEPFANPGSGFRRQIQALRAVVGPHIPMLVHIGWYAPDGTPRDASDAQLNVWAQSIDALADPHTQIVRLPSTRSAASTHA